MNKNLQPGDLCLIVKCRMDPDLIGRSVTLVQPLGPGESFRVEGTKLNLRNYTDNETAWIVEGGVFTLEVDGWLLDVPQIAIAEDCLMKIDGKEPDLQKSWIADLTEPLEIA